MRVKPLIHGSTFVFILFLVFIDIPSSEAKSGSKKKNRYATAAEEVEIPLPEPKPKATPISAPSAKKTAKSESIAHKSVNNDAEFSIEDVDEEGIDHILKDTTKNLVVFFCMSTFKAIDLIDDVADDGRVKCPQCHDALSEMEEIDDDIESTGYIEVVKTDDRRVARECGVSTFPAMVYFRRKNPILYDGEFKDSEVVWRWIRAHDEVATWELTDFNFETRTDSFSPDEGSLDWFVMFYDSDDLDCAAFVPALETVAHKLRGLVNVGKVDIDENDDVAERFRVDDNQCPTFILFHRGKMYRYSDPAKDVRGLTNFALNKFKDQRSHRVPEPPNALENIYELVKERALELMKDNHTLSIVCISGAIVIITIALFLKALRIRSSGNSNGQTEKKTS
ncbi:Thioredoxin domain-containing protein [Aphelenchoides besseyi]|nr:Thioredoxin domain-containing protein [Aphelenchoides besseyi]